MSRNISQNMSCNLSQNMNFNIFKNLSRNRVYRKLTKMERVQENKTKMACWLSKMNEGGVCPWKINKDGICAGK